MLLNNETFIAKTFTVISVGQRRFQKGLKSKSTGKSMPERLECEVLQKARYINTLTFTFTFK